MANKFSNSTHISSRLFRSSRFMILVILALFIVLLGITAISGRYESHEIYNKATDYVTNSIWKEDIDKEGTDPKYADDYEKEPAAEVTDDSDSIIDSLAEDPLAEDPVAQDPVVQAKNTVAEDSASSTAVANASAEDATTTASTATGGLYAGEDGDADSLDESK
ncbi:uncharacterized protein RJT21DRAFT_121392 [Scheffersomyces amazonensis]|uniref:uncharacterized protein n=1 Tax=Scheffersomyces amazonensis TaxID=1078765 RepID=UPI00315D4335